MAAFDEAWLIARGYTLVGERAIRRPVQPVQRRPARTTRRTVRKRRLPTGAITEQALLTKVRALAKQEGYLTYHTWNSEHSEPGFPDLVLVKPGKRGRAGRLIFAELKSTTGKLTMHQQHWLAFLKRTVPAIEVYTWRPQDWLTIMTCLTRKDV